MSRAESRTQGNARQGLRFGYVLAHFGRFDRKAAAFYFRHHRKGSVVNIRRRRYDGIHLVVADLREFDLKIVTGLQFEQLLEL